MTDFYGQKYYATAKTVIDGPDEAYIRQAVRRAANDEECAWETIRICDKHKSEIILRIKITGAVLETEQDLLDNEPRGPYLVEGFYTYIGAPLQRDDKTTTTQRFLGRYNPETRRGKIFLTIPVPTSKKSQHRTAKPTARTA